MNFHLNVYKQELELLSEHPQNWRERITSAFYRRILRLEMQNYRFIVPSSYYLRGEMLCEDISEIGELDYKHEDLLHLLVNDFLRNVRRLSDPHRIYHELLLRDRRPIKINSKRNITTNNHTNTVEIQLRVRRNIALRLEVLRADITELYPESEFSVEGVLEILYCDFIDAFKRGELKNIVERIVENEKGQ